MIHHQPFHYHSLEDLRSEIAGLGLDIPVADEASVLASPVQAGDFRLANRMVVLPMEGCDGNADGSPGELTFRRYRRFASGGSGLLWFEATAVVPEGRANPRQLWLHAGVVDKFARLVADTRRVAPQPVKLILQLTHSGRYSKPGAKARPIIAHRSRYLDPLHNLGPDYPLITDEELEQLEEAYVVAARLAAQTGFDGVDVKACHRYLISELHASHTREDSRYGGPFENRTRFFRNVVAKIRDHVPGLTVTSRMNAYDAMAHPYGFGVDVEDPAKPDLREPLELVGYLRDQGAPLVNITIGNPYFNPYVNRPFDLPVCGAPVPPEHPLEGVARFLHVVRAVQQAYPDMLVIGGGYTWLRQYFPNVAAAAVKAGWVSLAGAGRMAFAYPEFARRIVLGMPLDAERVCVACSACTQIMRDGGRSGCVPRDAEIYEPIYRAGRAEALDTITAMAKSCRQCNDPTCVPKCPAHVNVPKFVGAIADGRFRDAYEALRESNLLAAICGYVCPSETLCESGCINEHYTEPVPIRHLQRWVSRKGVEEGWAAELRPPQRTSGKRVAVIGAGPAGVAGAVTLASLGHTPVLFERSAGMGGMVRETIPADRMPDSMLKAEIEAVLQSAGGVERRTLALGPDVSVKGLLADGFDAVLLAAGMSQSSALPCATRPQTGVLGALEFLRESKRGRSLNGTVLVLGGGNTAIDAAVSALRAGASDVSLVYRRSFAEMPAWPVERDAAIRAGVHFLILTQPLDYEADENGRLTGLRVVRTRLGGADDSGRRRPVEVAGSEHVLPADWVIEALGQRIEPGMLEALSGISCTPAGLVSIAPGTLATTHTGVFAAGDIVSGGATVVQAVAQGTQAAREIDYWLRGQSALLAPNNLVHDGVESLQVLRTGVDVR